MMLGETAPAHAVDTGSRLLPLDALRGATIAAMLLVSSPEDPEAQYAPLRHSGWHGWTFTDAIAPCFMWVVGVALSISLGRRLARGDSTAAIIAHAGRRSMLLFMTGFFLGLLPALIEVDWAALANFKVMGTLQRIAMGSFFATVVLVLLPRMRDQIVVVIVALLSYSALFLLYPVPGVGTGNFTESGNIVSFLDGELLGPHSARSHPLLSGFAGSATVLLGALVGGYVRKEGSAVRMTGYAAVTGCTLFLGGLVLGEWIPLNFRLWTPSFCLSMAGIATLAFAIFYGLAEVMGVRRGLRPLVIFGLNPIAMWVGSILAVDGLSAVGVVGADGAWRSLWTLSYLDGFAWISTSEARSVVFGLTHVVAFFGLAYLLQRRGWVIRL